MRISILDDARKIRIDSIDGRRRGREEMEGHR